MELIEEINQTKRNRRHLAATRKVSTFQVKRKNSNRQKRDTTIPLKMESQLTSEEKRTEDQTSDFIPEINHFIANHLESQYWTERQIQT